MEGNEKIPGKLAAGMYLEDGFLKVVCITRHQKEYRLIDAEVMETSPSFQMLGAEVMDSAGLEMADDKPFDWSELGEEASTDDSSENIDTIKSVLQRLPDKVRDITVVLSEPNVRYAMLDIDPNQKESQLKKDVLEKLAENSPGDEKLKPDQLAIMPIARERVLAIIRESDALINMMKTASDEIKGRASIQIKSVDTTECALAYLINQQYDFSDETVSLIVNVGSSASRIMLMEGNRILSISDTINAGSETDQVNEMLMNRIRIELDGFNITSPQWVFLVGEAYDIHLHHFFAQEFSTPKPQIEYLGYAELTSGNNEPILSRFAVPIASTLKLYQKPKTDINLIPEKILDSQKIFKLGLPGILLLALIPIATLYFTWQISAQQQEIHQTQNTISSLKLRLGDVEQLENQFKLEKRQLKNLKRTTQVMDSLMVGAKTWSSLLNTISVLKTEISGVWVTGISQKNAKTATIEGYSLYRNRIPQFTEALGKHANLTDVQLDKIRQQRVYKFRINIRLNAVKDPV